MYFFFGSGSHGQETSFCPGCQRRADRVHARNEFSVRAELVQNGFAHARHDAHVDDDVGRVGNFNADFADGRIQRPHRERDDIHRAALHAALEPLEHRFFHLGRIGPVVRRPGFFLRFRADERPVFHARHVARMRPREIRAGALFFVQLDERAAARPSSRTATGFPRPSRRTSGCCSGWHRAAISLTQEISF